MTDKEDNYCTLHNLGPSVKILRRQPYHKHNNIGVQDEKDYFEMEKYSKIRKFKLKKVEAIDAVFFSKGPNFCTKFDP